MDPLFADDTPFWLSRLPWWLLGWTLSVSLISLSCYQQLLRLGVGNFLPRQHQHFLPESSQIPENARMVSKSVFGKYWKPFLQILTEDVNQTGNYFCEMARFPLKSICWRKSSICAKSWSGWTLINLINHQITGTLAAFRFDNHESSPLPRGSSAGHTMKGTVSTSRRGAVCRFYHKIT